MNGLNRVPGDYVKHLALIALIVGCVGCKSYDPMSEAESAMGGDATVQVINNAKSIQFLPTNFNTQGLILYPGASVDPRSYAPMALAIAQQGVTVTIAKFPLELAVLAPNSAGGIRAALPTVTEWWLSGHSLGGVMATQYRNNNLQDPELAGIILLAAYPQTKDDISGSSIPVLSLFASEDQLTTVAKIEQTKSLLPIDATYFEISGGNHAQFGWYGAQDGDGKATISREQQQNLIVDQIITFLTH